MRINGSFLVFEKENNVGSKNLGRDVGFRIGDA